MESRQRRNGTDPRIVFDVGMNICEDTEFYLKKGFNVVAVEANSALCQAACARYAAEIASGRLTILNFAVSDSEGSTRFYVCREMTALSTVDRELVAFWTARGMHFDEVPVPAVRFETILAERGIPYYLKIDIEGSDLLCLEALRKVSERPRFLSFEVDFATGSHALELCCDLGYRRFKLVGQKSVPLQSAPHPPREGLYVDGPFKMGASGLFGAEVPGPWECQNSIDREIRRIRRHHRLGRCLRLLGGAAGCRDRVERFVRSYLWRTGDWWDVHAAH